MLICLIPFLTGVLGLWLLDESNAYGRLACLWISLAYTATCTLSMSVAVANTAGGNQADRHECNLDRGVLSRQLRWAILLRHITSSRILFGSWYDAVLRCRSSPLHCWNLGASVATKSFEKEECVGIERRCL